MNGADWFILALILASTAIGLMRGLMREAISLAAWLLGLWLAWTFSSLVEPYLGGLLAQPGVKVWVARLIILLAVLLIGGIVTMVVTYFVHHSPFSPIDRFLGLLFGFLRGGIVIGLAAIVGQLLQLQGESWWLDSTLMPYAELCGDWIRRLVNDVQLS